MEYFFTDKKELERQKILTVTEKVAWGVTIIQKMLKNEKYSEDVLL